MFFFHTKCWTSTWCLNSILPIITSCLLPLLSSSNVESCFSCNQTDLFKMHIRGWPLSLYSEEGSFSEFFVMLQQFSSFSLGIALAPVFSNKKYSSVLSPSHAIKQKSNRFFILMKNGPVWVENGSISLVMVFG